MLYLLYAIVFFGVWFGFSYLARKKWQPPTNSVVGSFLAGIMANPAISAKPVGSGFLAGLVTLVAVGAIFEPGKPVDAAAMATEEAACMKDLKCWARKDRIDASVRCEQNIERLAKYSFEWTNNWHETRLNNYRWLDESKGIVTYYGDRMKSQNGFGAWQNIVYECDYEPKAGRALEVRARAGRLTPSEESQ